MKNIIKSLNELKNPYNCPHGRPVKIIIKKQEIDKLFKRNI